MSATHQSIALELAEDVAAQLENAIANQGRAILALSGGSTPKPFLQELAGFDLDWSKVVVTLVDERWVSPSHELSNAAMVQQCLLDKVANATFVPLYQAANRVEDSLSQVLQNYAELTQSSVREPAKFDVAILGLGSDGHTASFFPDADTISDLVNPDQSAPLLSCQSPSSQVERVTWSLNMLLRSDFLALHFTGQEKKMVFDKASQSGSAEDLPIRAFIHQHQNPLHIYFAE